MKFFAIFFNVSRCKNEYRGAFSILQNKQKKRNSKNEELKLGLVS